MSYFNVHKKLKKYIESYFLIDHSSLNNNSFDLVSNGGMTVLINSGSGFELLINEKTYQIKESQTILLNAYEHSIFLNFKEEVNVVAIRFRGAGASFFFNDLMDKVEQDIVVFKEQILCNNNMTKKEDFISILDTYFQNKYKPSTLPFNIMSIISLVEEKNGEYDIDDILACANIPRRIFDKIFRRQVGLSLKTYAKTIKDLSL